MKALLRRFAGPLGLAVTLGTALAVALLLLVTAPRPAEAVSAFFLGAFRSSYAFGNMLSAAVPLTIAGLGIAVAFRAGVYNLGGEGQVYASGAAAAAFALAFPQTAGMAGKALAVGFAAAVGAVLAGIPGVLRRRLGTNELIASYLISATAILVTDYLIAGPLDDPSSNLISTAPVAAGFRLARLLPPSHLSGGLFLAAGTVVVIAFLINDTRWGYELRLCGANPQFARYGGIEVGAYLVAPMVASGALHGLAGGVALLGVYHRAIGGFSAGTGWNAIAVALIARNRPEMVPLAALLYAYLDAGARAATVLAGVSFEMILLVQAVIFYLITAQSVVDFFLSRRAP